MMSLSESSQSGVGGGGGGGLRIEVVILANGRMPLKGRLLGGFS